jgi:hypothetical protein
MMAFEALEQERMAFLSALYTRSAGDARQGVPYEALIDALGFEERVTKGIQRALQREGLVELTDVPQITTVGRTVMDHAQRPTHQQTIAMTPQGLRLMQEIVAYHAAPPSPPSAASQPA